jgi:hypothetical protein
LYRSHWVQNLEHIADQVTTTTTDKSAYQYLLLNRVLNNTNFQPVKNTLLQSSIKQRIMMLNKTKTPKLLSLKSLIIIPFLIVLVMNFQIKVNAQVKKPLGTGTEPNQKTYIDSVKKSTNIYDNKIIIFKITKNASQEYLNTSKSELKTSYNIDLIYTDIIYNENGELTSIHVEVDCNDGFKGTMGQTLPLGIPDLYMYRDYTDRGKSPFGVGAFSESEVQGGPFL